MRLTQCLTCVLCLAMGSGAIAQPAPESSYEVPLATEIEARRDALPESQQAARALYDEAIARLGRAASSLEAAATFRAATESAPALLETIREELLQPASRPELDVPADASLSQLEQREAEAASALAAARELESQLQAETTKRQERRIQIQDAVSLRRQQLLQVEEQLKVSAADGGDAELANARRTALLAERYEVATKLEELEAERASYDARRDLLPARRDRAARRVGEAEALATAWREFVSKRRQQEAERSARQAELARQQAARQHPALQAFAAETKRLADQRTEANAIPQRIDAASRQVAEARSSFSNLRQRYLAVKQRIDVSGLNRATGLMLRREFESLPNLTVLARRDAAVDRELEDIEYLLFERRDERIGSDDVSLVTQSLLSKIANTLERDGVEAVATELAIARRDVLAKLENDASSYQDVLVELDRITDQLLEATDQYESFIRERILWVRSIPAEQIDVLEDLDVATEQIFPRDTWILAWDRTRADIVSRFPTTTLAGLAIILLFIAGRFSKQRIVATADLVKRYRTDRFSHSLLVVVLTAVAALPVPAFLWSLGWVLVRPIDQVPIAAALGVGLQTAAYPSFGLLFLALTLRPTGLGPAHFRWPAKATRFVRRHVRWLIFTLVPSIALITAVGAYGDEQLTASLGRIAFSVAMLAVTAFAIRVLRPHGPLVGESLRANEDGWLNHLRHVWYPVAILIPLSLAVLSWMGFYYTSLQLERMFEATVVLCLILVFANGLLSRWLFVARRKVAVEDALRRREQAMNAAAAKPSSDEGTPAEGSPPPIDEDKLDLPSISLQTQQLFRTAIGLSAAFGVYFIWADALPALRMLDRVEVFPNPQVLEEHEDVGIALLETVPISRAGDATPTTPATPPPPASPPSVTPGMPAAGVAESSSDAEPESIDTEGVSVTLADLGLAIILLLATAVAFRNLPGLTEMVVLQRLPLDAGSRYALSTVLKYAIALVGATAAFSALNIAWSNVQWLAAALTFGLAFGLQEIFANFISGLIILAERPIRIGDTVTVGGVSGTVSRIRMRATTITDWDRKELVIPNKSFITGDVINWTLSDPTLRVIVPVGVSYDADIRKAESLLLQVADELSNVLKDPKPYVVFGNLGDSTLDFELRVFIPHVDCVLSVRHELHMRIVETFREANIEIAFPQRDLNIRSIGDLRELIVKPDELTAGRS